MKYEIIKTDNYLLVVDESEIKEGNKSLLNVEGFEPMILTHHEPIEEGYQGKKIIAHLPLNGSPILEGVELLPPLEQEDDVEKIADDLYPDSQYEQEIVEDRKLGFISGYNKAKEKYKYTEEDIIRIVEKSRATGLTAEYLMLTLSQPKIPIGFECVTSPMNIDEIKEQGKGFLNANTKKIKTTTSEGHKEWMGIYIYE